MKKYLFNFLLLIISIQVGLCASGDISPIMDIGTLGGLSSSGTAPNTFFLQYSQILNIPAPTITGASDKSLFFTGTQANIAISLSGSLNWNQIYNVPPFSPTIAGSTDFSTFFSGTSALNALSLSGTITSNQVSGLSTVATTGTYNDLLGKPTLGTASSHAATDFATSSQGNEADSAIQGITAGTALLSSTVGKIITLNFNNPGYITSSGTSLLSTRVNATLNSGTLTFTDSNGIVQNFVSTSTISGASDVNTYFSGTSARIALIISGTIPSVQVSGLPTNLNQFTNGPGYQTLTGTVASITGTIPSSQISGLTTTIAGASDYATYFMGIGKSKLSGTSDYSLLSGTALLITGTIPNTQVSGLGTASTHASTDFATSSQGSEADSALQNSMKMEMDKAKMTADTAAQKNAMDFQQKQAELDIKRAALSSI